MTRKLERDALAGELRALDALLSRIDPNDIVMRVGYSSRREEIAGRLAAIERQPDTTARATIFFGGRRVLGSDAIDAEFAATSLRAFQSLVTASALVGAGERVGARGPLSDRDELRLNITGTARGSFGFVLEENADMGRPLFASAMKDAIERATTLIASFAGTEEDFSSVLDGLDARVLQSARDLFRMLDDADATFRLVGGEREAQLGRDAVRLAHERAARTRVDEGEIEFEGVLLGLTPVSRGFDFKPDNLPSPIRGKTGPQLGRTYLERIERGEGPALGRGRWLAKVRRRRVEMPSGSVRETYTLLDLTPREGPPLERREE